MLTMSASEIFCNFWNETGICRIHVAWSNGSTLAAIHGIDVIRRID